jgi:hypothetical protein
MTSAEARALTNTLARWLAAITSLLFAFSRFLPSGRPGSYGFIETAWIQMLHFAFVERLQFGRDIVFTFGPWGFLYGEYHPATYLLSVFAWAVLGAVFWWAAWRVITHFCKNPFVCWLWITAVIALASISPTLNMDVRLTAWPLLLLLLHFCVEERPLTWTQAMLVLSLALVSLIKNSIFTVAIVTVLVVGADNIFRQRRFPWTVVLFAAGIFVFWVLAGQQLTGFGLFLRGASEIINGYTEAMMMGWSGTEKADILRFWGAAIAVCALVGYVVFKQHRLFGLFPLLGVAFILFAAFKHGYVRHDIHEVTATNLLLLAALLWLPAAWSIAWQRSKWLIPAVVLPLVLATSLASLSLKRYASSGLFLVPGEQFTARNLFAPANFFLEFLEDRRHSFRRYNTYVTDLRAKAFPDLDIHGAADVYPISQTLTLPQSLTCRPRPVFQSYSAYTPELAEMNAAHLRSDRAADHIFFGIGTIDDRFAPQDDSLSWPELLTRYEITGMSGQYVLMKRSATPRHYQLRPVGETVATFDEAVAVPSTAGGPIWVRIDIRRSLWGNMIAMLYRPSPVWLTVVARGGEYRGRLVPGEARAGFLLSPLVDNGQSFFALASTNWQQELQDREVTSARVTADDAQEISSHYQSPPVRMRFYRLDFERQTLDQTQ